MIRPLTWGEPPAVKRPTPRGDSWEDEFWDVVPIPYFPDDLPRLRFIHWARPELDMAFEAMRDALFPLASP